ncbi:MAG: hypothetical protein ACPIA1_07280 [Flavobacteriaceae bacterium]
MLKLFRTFLGLLFFVFFIGVLVVKNQPNTYELILRQHIDHPSSSYIDYLKSIEGENFWTHMQDKNHWLKVEQISMLRADKENIERLIPSTEGFALSENWVLSDKDQTLELYYNYEVDFLTKAFFLFNPSFFSELRQLAHHRINNVISDIDTRYQSHQWKYQGKTTYPSFYYLAMEGEASWISLKAHTIEAQLKLVDFARENNIRTIGTPFVVYPLLLNKRIKWRAALQVEQYYDVKTSDIQCRRFRGGEALVLNHIGDERFLKKSWGILLDSLQNRRQAYPAFQKETSPHQYIQNPLQWETTLILPIQ